MAGRERGDLIRIDAPHFVAGLIVRDGICVEAAPILGWALGRDEQYLRTYFKRKRWKATRVPPLTQHGG